MKLQEEVLKTEFMIQCLVDYMNAFNNHSSCVMIQSLTDITVMTEWDLISLCVWNVWPVSLSMQSYPLKQLTETILSSFWQIK